jgi:hypothetical protein
MAVTRKFLEAMGLDDAKISAIIEEHDKTVNGLKELRDKYKADADKLAEVQKKLDEATANNGDDWKSKYEKEHNDFESYKKGVTEKETKAAKEKAVKAYFEGKNITGANLEIAMRGASAEIAGVELDGDKIKDTAALDALVNGTFAGLVVTKSVHGAQTANPPANNGGKAYKTKEEILAIKDRAERQNAIAENHEMFGF